MSETGIPNGHATMDNLAVLCFYIWVLQTVRIISLSFSRVNYRAKMGDLQEKPPHQQQAELGLSHM